MEIEQIEKILNKVIKDRYPELNVKIRVSSEPHPLYLMVTEKKIYNVYFSVGPDDYVKYVHEGSDKPMWDNIRGLIRDLIKMFGITDKVRFYFI